MKIENARDAVDLVERTAHEGRIAGMTRQRLLRSRDENRCGVALANPMACRPWTASGRQTTPPRPADTLARQQPLGPMVEVEIDVRRKRRHASGESAKQMR
ncbi:hypothetical protein B7R78_0018025 [Ralstonia solanacearum]|uniref:hypothetical protein n=1 Tax=Ralstonia solanacearum species complex TaxID=3116862 RepID=UPI00113FF339|nr:hypothetical protein [Ralstonia solanacearum]MBT1538926.1 hypothetical protein [Ralstonia solanacearum]QOK84826.1 hypothetical protein HF906_22755 [Ralstonia solanacearum]